MAKAPAANRTHADKFEDVPAAGDENITDKEAASLALIRSVFNDSRGGAVDIIVGVYVVTQPPGKAAYDEWMFDCELSELDNLRTRLRDEFGPGRYRCRVKKDGQPWSQYDLRIAPNPRQARAAAAAAMPAAVAPGAEISPALAAILEQQNRILNMMAERITAPAQSQAGGMKDLLELMKAMREANPPPPPNIGIELFTKGIELAQKFQPGNGEGGGKGLIDLVSEVLQSPAITNVIAGLAQRTPQGPSPATARNPGSPAALPMHRPVAAQPPLPAGASAAPAGGLGPAPSLQQIITFLISKAQEGAQPDLIADWVVDNIPEAGLAYIETQPDPIEYLAGLFPAVGQHRAWFANLFTAIYGEAADEPGAVNDDGVQMPGEQPPTDDRNTGRRGRNARGAETHAGGSPQGQT